MIRSLTLAVGCYVLNEDDDGAHVYTGWAKKYTSEQHQMFYAELSAIFKQRQKMQTLHEYVMQ